MRILLCNKFYYRRGGDCICTLNLEQLLESHGHNVALFAMDYSENLPNSWSKYFPSEVSFKPNLRMLEAFKRPFGTNEVKKKFNALLDDFRPDIVHLHNIHTQLSPILAELAHERDIRVIWTLHDYKLLCPRYDCLRNGTTVCEACFGDKHKVLEYRCMKNSLVASYLAYKEAMTWTHKRLESITNTFICPSRFMAMKMEKGGFDKHKLTTICNFIDVSKTKKVEFNKEEYYCFVGRLSHEKGIDTLLRAACQLPFNLKIIGGGPLEEHVRQRISGHKHIECLGFKEWNELKLFVGKARFTVIPSEWYENNPLSVIEAQCLGTPVLGSRIGGIPELIEEGVNGLLFETGNENDLKQKIGDMFASSFNYRELAECSQKKYTADKYYEKLMQIYEA